MRRLSCQWVVGFWMLFHFHASATTLYVNLNSTNPVSPYADWSTAATNIQDAIDVSSDGDLVLVTNGLYQAGNRLDEHGVTNRVAMTKAVTVESVNGPGVTVIVGSGTVRCVYLTNNAVLIGFTLTNGNPLIAVEPGLANGGGAWCESGSSVLSNCVLTGNSALNGGGAYGGTLNNCLLTGNSASADFTGGGGAYGGVLNYCVVRFNQATGGRGGGAGEETMHDCLVISNSSLSGQGGGVAYCNLYNSVVVNNSGGGVIGGYLANCIVYYNDTNYPPSGGAEYIDSWYSSDTTPLPKPPTHYVSPDTITNEPLFVNTTNDFHLQSNSPCINSGNNTYVTGATDLDGNPRIAGGTVDIGPYEYQTPVSEISYAWLDQYGLPITTNIDGSDLDGTGFNVYQDWIAGLNPTNALSVLAMLLPVPTNSPTGLIVSWESVNNRTYYLQSSTNLAAQPAFFTIRSNIVGQTGTTTYMDTNAVGNGPFFYRVGVQ